MCPHVENKIGMSSLFGVPKHPDVLSFLVGKFSLLTLLDFFGGAFDRLHGLLVLLRVVVGYLAELLRSSDAGLQHSL
jgi:hypothetical protein